MPAWLSDWLPILTFVGSFVGPMIAAFALLHAVKRADANLKEWRLQKLAERDADVARDALKLVLRYCDALGEVASPFKITGSPFWSREDRDKELNARWGGFTKLDHEYDDMYWLVRAQLGDAEADAMDKIWKMKSRLVVAQELFLEHRDRELYNEGFGPKALETLGLDAAKTDARALLNRHIRMEGVKGS